MTKNFFLATLVALMVFVPSSMQAKVEHLLPRPQQVTATDGTAFALGRPVTIYYLGGAQECALLNEFFTKNCSVVTAGGAAVNVSLVESIDGAHDYKLYGYENEAYTLEITANEINITAVTATGIIRAAQTLTQLAEGYEGAAALEALTMKDWPAFKLRGYMHDVGRSFIEFETLKKHIDLLSRFKVNTFHWHMTENQAWRFEVKAFPQLTSNTSMTRFAGKYYTQEQCRALQDYAFERGVVVIPEIDMPGHSEAFVRAMGYDMQTDNGVAALKTILEEVAAVFDKAPYIHIGADEKDITYTNFLNIMTGKLHDLGKKVVVWNPIRNVAITTNTGADMTQMWSSSGKVINGMPNIDCRYNYTNHFDVFADLVGIYKSNIYYAEKGSSDIAGTISAPWNDRKTPTEEDIIKQNNFYANVIASAERAWIGGGKQYIEKGGTTLPNSGEEYEEFASWERRFLFHKANSLKNEPIPYVKQTNVRWRITEPFPNGGNMNAEFAPETDGKSATVDMQDSYTVNGTTYKTAMATGAGIYLRHTWGNNTVPTYYGSTNHNNVTSYAWTYIYSDKEQTVGAQIEFQNYGRSEKDTAPDAGKWDRKGSDIWLNGERIAPPTWGNTGVSINNEVDLKNENFTARKPLSVTLKPGWNKVFIKLPYVGASGVRLNKWMFTFVLTDLDGVNAVEGLVYSPNQRMDAAADQLAAVLAEVRIEVANSVGDQPGQCNKKYAAEVEAVIARIEATIDETMTEDERATQMAELDAALETFKKSPVNFPLKVSDADAEYYYTMCTPQRGNRYVTSKGANAAIVGETASTEASKWKFIARADGKYDIVNKSDNTYISPASANNTALCTQSTSPANGWVLKNAATAGLYIVVSSDVQFNQQNNGSYNVLNWGSGSNTTDTGCQYLITEADAVIEGVELSTPDDFVNGEIYYFETLRGVLGATTDNANLVSSAKTSLDARMSNPFCQWTVYKSTNGKYYLYNIGKGMFMGATTTNNGSIPFTENPTNDALVFKSSTKSGYPIMFSCNANTGVVNHSTDQGTGALYWADGWNKTDDDGSCHKVTKIGELDKETLAAIRTLVGDIVDAPKSFLSIAELEDEAYPYVIAAELAQDVFEKGNLTIAVNVTIADNLSGRGAIVCAADPTHAITGATKNNSPYIGYGFNGKKPAYLPSSASGDVFTAEGENLAAGNYKVVYVVDKENKNLKTYVNKALMSSANYPLVGYELQSFSNFAANENAKLYIGGGMVNNKPHDVFAGEIHSVHFFDEALDATAIANIDYSFVTEGDEETTVIDGVKTENENVKAGIYDLAGRKVKEVVNPGIYIVNGAKKVIR